MTVNVQEKSKLRLRDQIFEDDGVPKWTIVKRCGRWRACSPGPIGTEIYKKDAERETYQEALDYALSMICKEWSA